MKNKILCISLILLFFSIYEVTAQKHDVLNFHSSRMIVGTFGKDTLRMPVAVDMNWSISDYLIVAGEPMPNFPETDYGMKFPPLMFFTPETFEKYGPAYKGTYTDDEGVQWGFVANTSLKVFMLFCNSNGVEFRSLYTIDDYEENQVGE